MLSFVGDNSACINCSAVTISAWILSYPLRADKAQMRVSAHGQGGRTHCDPSSAESSSANAFYDIYAYATRRVPGPAIALAKALSSGAIGVPQAPCSGAIGLGIIGHLPFVARVTRHCAAAPRDRLKFIRHVP